MKTEKTAFFDHPENLKRVLRVFYLLCALLLLLDFILHRHSYHAWEKLPAFYPLYGFVGCVVLVLVAKWMRTFLMRDEDYYEQREQSPEQSSQKTSGEKP
jgi:hypothetical protein